MLTNARLRDGHAGVVSREEEVGGWVVVLNDPSAGVAGARIRQAK